MKKATLLILTLSASICAIANEMALTNKNPSQIVTQSREEYFKVKNHLMTDLINTMDFSDIDLEKNTSYSLGSEEARIETHSYNTKGELEVTTCEYVYDTNIHTIIDGDKLITVTDEHNKTASGDSNCREDQLKDSREVSVFKNPTKENYKMLLIESLNMSMSLYMANTKDRLLDEKVLFNVSNDGFVALFSNDDYISYHKAKPINHRFVFAEMMEYLKNLSPLRQENLDLNKKIDSLVFNDFYYVTPIVIPMAFYNKFHPEKIKYKTLGSESISLQAFLNEMNIQLSSNI